MIEAAQCMLRGFVYARHRINQNPKQAYIQSRPIMYFKQLAFGLSAAVMVLCAHANEGAPASSKTGAASVEIRVDAPVPSKATVGHVDISVPEPDIRYDRNGRAILNKKSEKSSTARGSAASAASAVEPNFPKIAAAGAASAATATAADAAASAASSISKAIPPAPGPVKVYSNMAQAAADGVDPFKDSTAQAAAPVESAPVVGAQPEQDSAADWKYNAIKVALMAVVAAVALLIARNRKKGQE